MEANIRAVHERGDPTIIQLYKELRDILEASL
jgi:hypothetical protein